MLYAIVGMLVIILDQGVKFWVTNHIFVNTVTEPLIPGVISLVHMQNDGAAFSFLAGGGARIYFIILTGVFTVAVILALVTNFISGRFGRWCLVLVTAGGLANCLDRILYGYVVDMFKIDLFNFAVFNVADIFITVFCILFIIYIIFGGEDHKDTESEFEEDDEDLDRPSYKESLKANRKEAKAEAKASAFAKREKKRGAKYAEADFEEELSPRFPGRKTAPEKKAPAREALDPAAEKPASRSGKQRRSRYEEEYQAYMSSRPDAKAEMARKAAAPASKESAVQDPFAAWERANAKAESRHNSSYTAKAMGVKPSRESTAAAPQAPATAPAPVHPPVERVIPEPPKEVPRPAPQSAAAKAEAKPDSGLDFSLDDILSEFK